MAEALSEEKFRNQNGLSFEGPFLFSPVVRMAIRPAVPAVMRVPWISAPVIEAALLVVIVRTVVEVARRIVERRPRDEAKLLLARALPLRGPAQMMANASRFGPQGWNWRRSEAGRCGVRGFRRRREEQRGYGGRKQGKFHALLVRARRHEFNAEPVP